MKTEQCQDNIKDKIYEAIAEFVKIHGTVQSMIYLCRSDYNELLNEARSTELGRAFTSNGMHFCQLDVRIHAGSDIVIV